MGLSHIINAEGEKIQYLLGTLDGIEPPADVTVEQILQANDSVRDLLRQAAVNQQALSDKMKAALDTSSPDISELQEEVEQLQQDVEEIQQTISNLTGAAYASFYTDIAAETPVSVGEALPISNISVATDGITLADDTITINQTGTYLITFFTSLFASIGEATADLVINGQSGVNVYQAVNTNPIEGAQIIEVTSVPTTIQIVSVNSGNNLWEAKKGINITISQIGSFSSVPSPTPVATSNISWMGVVAMTYPTVFNENDFLPWNQYFDNSDGLITVDATGIITINKDGVYSIGITLNAYPQNDPYVYIEINNTITEVQAIGIVVPSAVPGGSPVPISYTILTPPLPAGSLVRTQVLGTGASIELTVNPGTTHMSPNIITITQVS